MVRMGLRTPSLRIQPRRSSCDRSCSVCGISLNDVHVDMRIHAYDIEVNNDTGAHDRLIGAVSVWERTCMMCCRRVYH